MGTMTFQLPAGLPADAVRELERTCVGGPDNMPWPTEVHFHNGRMSVRYGLTIVAAEAARFAGRG
jgi:hypothetical protein